jgi:TonB family protein
MKNSPNVPTEQKQEVSSTPPTPRQQTQPQPQKPTPPQPKVQNGPRPDQPQQKPNPVPPKPAPKPTQQIDPLTGLPVLPPIQAQTLAQANPAQQSLAPARSRQQQETDVNGAIGMSEDNSPAAMATPRGKYMQQFRNIVGSYWYPAVDSQMSLISVGTVVIRFTVHSDGTISDITVLQGNDNPNFVLKNISVSALRSPAPFPPFPPEMIKDVGTSFTDEFSFGIY